MEDDIDYIAARKKARPRKIRTNILLEPEVKRMLAIMAIKGNISLSYLVETLIRERFEASKGKAEK